MAGYSTEARKQAALARSIKALLGVEAYRVFKKTGSYDKSALEAARKTPPSERRNKPSSAAKKTASHDQMELEIPAPARVKPAPQSQLVSGATVESSNSHRPGTIIRKKQTKDGQDAYLVKWDKGGGR